MSDSVRPHGQQSTRLLCPRDSPGKSTGLGCHFLLQKEATEPQVSGSLDDRLMSKDRQVKVKVSCSIMSDSLQLYELGTARLLCPRDSPGKSTGVGCHALLQGIFPTRGLNLRLLHLLIERQVLYH